MDVLAFLYTNSCDLAGNFFQQGYHNLIYLDVNVGEPEYFEDVEYLEDGEKNQIPVSYKCYKKYKINFVHAEYMLDALNLMKRHDKIFCRFKNNEVEEVHNVEVSHEWIQRGALANITVKFMTRYLYKGACCENYDYSQVYLRSLIGVSEQFDDSSVKWTAPVANGIIDGARVLVLHYTGAYTGNYVVYQMSYSSGGIWVFDTASNFPNASILVNSDDSSKWYCDGSNWHEYPQIISCVNVGTPGQHKVRVRGYSIPYTQVQLYHRLVGAPAWVAYGTPIDINTFQTQGIIVTEAAGGNHEYRFKSYKFPTNFGYSDAVQLVVI